MSATGLAGRFRHCDLIPPDRQPRLQSSSHGCIETFVFHHVETSRVTRSLVHHDGSGDGDGASVSRHSLYEKRTPKEPGNHLFVHANLESTSECVSLPAYVHVNLESTSGYVSLPADFDVSTDLTILTDTTACKAAPCHLRFHRKKSHHDAEPCSRAAIADYPREHCTPF